ncbi:MAG: transposase, partial [Firmicutes bacterium]|nr:transposase [Bacillota bacterium]
MIREIQLKNQLSGLDGTPVPEYDPSDGMETVEELKKYVRFLYASLQEKDRENLQIRKEMSEIKEELKAANRRADEEAAGRKRLFDKLEKFMDSQKSDEDEKKKLLRKIETLENRLKMANQALYGGGKTCSDKYSGQENVGINDGRDDFDGTEGSLPVGTPRPLSKEPSCDSASKDESTDISTPNDTQEEKEQQACYHGPSRKGWTYIKEVIGDPIVHKCVIPEGSKVKKYKKPRKVKTIVQRLEEHQFERVLVEFPDGTTKTITAPADEEGKEILEELVPGTGITATLLSYMIFNRYIMASPAYRESKNRYPDMDWHTCRQNLLNWEDKGAILLSKLLPALKDMALDEDANVNVDETWYRYQTHFGHRKTYMWCLVNRKAGIVIFFYEDTVDKKGKVHTGGRRRAVLKEFLGDAKIKSLQSDGYNVYMYLDDDMLDIEHICCLAHVHNKLQEAKKLGYKIVDFFLAQIKKLYKREKLYASNPDYYTPERIKDARNDEYTNDIVNSMHVKLLEMIAKGEHYYPDKVWRALNYFYNFWDRIFAYRNDGEYSIDNMAVERALRPLTVQRKNGL